MSRRSRNRLDTMTPRELLMVLTSMGQHVAEANATTKPRKAHGPRALKRRAKRRRAKALETRLRRNTWRSYHAEERRRARAEA